MSDRLVVRGLHTYIGEFHILQGAELRAPAAGCTVLLGRNGAGKTTTLRTIMGLLAPRQGEITLDGRPIAGLPAYRVAGLGLGYVPEDRGIFTDLTVEENMRLALRRGDRLEARLPRIFSLFPDLERFWRRKAGTLSGGQQQMLAIGRALVPENRLLLIDEPSKGLAPLLVQQVAAALQELKQETAILLVEQNFALAAAVGDTYWILDEGRTVHQGRMAELAANAELQAAYLGLGGGGAQVG